MFEPSKSPLYPGAAAAGRPAAVGDLVGDRKQGRAARKKK